MTNEIPEKQLSRRDFLSFTAKVGAASLVATAVSPVVGLVNVVQAAPASKVTPFNFAIISDAHLYDIPNHKFDGILEKAVEDVNNMRPAPDFVLFLGDLGQTGKRTELEKGKRILSKLKMPLHIIPGEHDWYLDMGAAWRDMFGSPNWSFDHKGVHFAGMNSILVKDFWTAKHIAPEERMGLLEELECTSCGLWGVREKQLEWLEKDVKKLGSNTPVVVLTHSPLWDYYPRWNFQTEDAPQIRSILSKFEKVMSFHGHVHQVVYNKIGNLTSLGSLSTSWPWPYPPVQLPFPQDKMNRSDPANFLDGLGTQVVDLDAAFGGDLKYKPWADLLPPAIKNGIKL
jgi:Icc protein